MSCPHSLFLPGTTNFCTWSADCWALVPHGTNTLLFCNKQLVYFHFPQNCFLTQIPGQPTAFALYDSVWCVMIFITGHHVPLSHQLLCLPDSPLEPVHRVLCCSHGQPTPEKRLRASWTPRQGGQTHSGPWQRGWSYWWVLSLWSFPRDASSSLTFRSFFSRWGWILCRLTEPLWLAEPTPKARHIRHGWGWLRGPGSPRWDWRLSSWAPNPSQRRLVDARRGPIVQQPASHVSENRGGRGEPPYEDPLGGVLSDLRVNLVFIIVSSSGNSQLFKEIQIEDLVCLYCVAQKQLIGRQNAIYLTEAVGSVFVWFECIPYSLIILISARVITTFILIMIILHLFTCVLHQDSHIYPNV